MELIRSLLKRRYDIAFSMIEIMSILSAGGVVVCHAVQPHREGKKLKLRQQALFITCGDIGQEQVSGLPEPDGCSVVSKRDHRPL